MALVVFVFAAVLMLDAGLKQTLVATGQPDNILVTRRSAGTEIQSGVDRTQAAIVESQPEIAIGPGGVSHGVEGSRRADRAAQARHGRPTNVTVRGVGAEGLALRPQVRVIAGRTFRPGSAEIVVGRSIAERFDGTGIGERLRFGGRDWIVVGVFDAGGSASTPRSGATASR